MVHYLQVEIPDNWPVKIIETTGQPMDESLRHAIGKLCNVLACAYGSTEYCLGTTTELSNPADFKEFNCGKPVPINGYEMKIVDSDGNTVPVNRRGELLIRGPGMFKEYINNPEKTKAVKSNDGWYNTDDLARMSEHGELFVEGRTSNVIISKGDNVIPEEMEAVLRRCPGIKDVLIVPVSDPACFQLICACVVPKDGYQLTEDDVRNYVNAFYNPENEILLLLPTFYMLLESFPKTKTGKNSRKRLQAMAESMFRNDNTR